MRRGNEHPNPNSGLTKEALKQVLKETIDLHVGYYCAQYGHTWPIDALEEICNEYTAKYRAR